MLDNLYTHPKWNTKAQSYSYPYCAGISQQDSRSNPQGQAKGLFYPSGPQFRCPKANNQEFIPFTKKPVGVDQAYPLKPVFHRKSHSPGEAGTDVDQNVSPGPPQPREFSYSSFGSRNWVNSSVVSTDAAPQEERAVVHPSRTEWMQIQRLEAAETLLKEKLKKTEEELRRIQKEKEQAEENEKRELQRMTLPRRRLKGHSNTMYKPVCSPESRSEEVFRPLKEKFSQPSEAQGSALQGSTSNSGLSRAPDSLDSSCSTDEPELGQCRHCGPKFLLLRLERHSNICSRMQGSKRKVFDSSRARVKGTKLEQYLNWKGPVSVEAELPWKSNWRQQHESFICTLRQGREIQQLIAKGGNPSDLPPILPAENPDYIHCPHCSCHFAPKVAEWHIPKCKTIKNRPPPPRKHYN
ncbi:hypothetical protein MC885_019887 [Smutsia gigantea]|nr:hypothetical protein MC885_019887 [Smutsia gigantea]